MDFLFYSDKLKALDDFVQDEWYSKDEDKGKSGVEGRSLGAIPKKFPAKDVREKSSKDHPFKIKDPFKITTVKPTLVKSGRSIVIHK